MPSHDHRLDIAHWDQKYDLLDRGAFIETLAKMLVEDVQDTAGKNIGKKATGFVIGLTGQWGLGKSTVVQYLHQHLSSQANVVSVLFNPWLFSGRDDLLDAFFRALVDALGRSDLEHAQEVVASVEKYWIQINKAGSPPIDPSIWTPIQFVVNILFSLFRPLSAPSLSERKIKIEKKIVKSKSAIVVIVDELDRIERSEVRAVAQLVKAVGEIKGISYLVAYDTERVVDALGHGKGAERKRRGSHYLEKIVQYPIPLRPLFKEDVETLLFSVLNSSNDLSQGQRTERQSEIWSWIVNKAETPREIKRLVGTFQALLAPLQDEVCKYDILAYSWLNTKAPLVREQISKNIDKIVDDPSEAEDMERARREYEKRPNPSPIDVFGSEAAAVSELLELMFPIFGEDRSSASSDPLRVSRRQNLIRTLYLGNPRNLVSKRDVFVLWSLETTAEMIHALNDYREKNLLPALIDRIRDHSEELPSSGDGLFWEAATSILVRDQDWIAGPSDGRALVEDLSAILFTLSRTSIVGKQRAKETLNYLIRQNELALVPYIFRRHLFRHGLTKHGNRESSEAIIWTKEETLKLLPSELARYEQAIVSGFALRRLPTLDTIYVIGNLSLWTEELRSILTHQLQYPEAIWTFAALTISPGLITDKASLEELMNTEKVRAAALELLPLEKSIPNVWLRVSTKRFLAALEGIDATFVSLDDNDA